MGTRILIASVMFGALSSSALATELTGHVGVYPAVLSVPLAREHIAAAAARVSKRDVHLVPALNGGDWITGRVPLRCQRNKPAETNPGQMAKPCVVM